MLTAVAQPYAPILIQGLSLYSSATTVARAQAEPAWPDGKDEPPTQNSPLPESEDGRSRRKATLRVLVTTAVLIKASVASSPVSWVCSLLVSLPSRYIPPAKPNVVYPSPNFET